jgi:hypothetical protein
MEYVIYVRSGYGVRVWRCVWGLGFRSVIGRGFFWSGVDGGVSFSLSVSSSTARQWQSDEREGVADQRSEIRERE